MPRGGVGVVGAVVRLLEAGGAEDMDAVHLSFVIRELIHGAA